MKTKSGNSISTNKSASKFTNPSSSTPLSADPQAQALEAAMTEAAKKNKNRLEWTDETLLSDNTFTGEPILVAAGDSEFEETDVGTQGIATPPAAPAPAAPAAAPAAPAGTALPPGVPAGTTIIIQQAAPAPARQAEEESGGGAGFGFVLGGLTAVGLGAAALAGGKKKSATSTTPSTTTLSGKVIDGYISGADVYVDTNNNGQLDAADTKVGTTNSSGDFNITLSSTQVNLALFVTGGTDISTGLAFHSVMKAPAGSTVVNPITTLIQGLVEKGVSLANAKTQVKAALGLSSVTQELTQFDPFASGTPSGVAAQVQAAAIKVASLIVAGSSALIGASSAAGIPTTQQSQDASEAMFDALVTRIQSGSANISDQTTVNTIIQSAAASSILVGSLPGVNSTAPSIAAAAKAISSSNTVIDNTPGTSFSSIINTQIVTQGAFSNSLASGDAGKVEWVNGQTQTSIGTLSTHANSIVADTTAPNAPTITGLLNDSGRSATDKLTNDARLAVSGVESGASLLYQVNGGNWSSTISPAQGQNTVLVRQVDAAGNISASSNSFAFRFDNTAPNAPSSILVGSDIVISAAESTAATALTIPQADLASIASITVTGLNSSGQTVSVSASPNLSTGTWQFDATSFANGPLSVQTFDLAGNPATSTLQLIKNTLGSGQAQVSVGGDAYINAGEINSNTSLVTLNVLASTTDTITGVSVRGATAVGFSQTIQATFDPASGGYSFDASNFADGSLTVTVTTTGTPGGITSTLTLDTLAPTGPITIDVGGNTTIDATETSVSTPLTISAPAGESVTAVSVSGTGTNGTALTLSASPVTGTSNWTFDATQFQPGSLTVQSTLIDVAGNTATTTNTLTLSTSGGTPTSLPPLTVGLFNDTGANNIDRITSDGRISISGQSLGATIEYRPVGSNTWSTTFTPQNGENTVDIRQVQGSVSSQPVTLSFTLDTQAPAPSLSVPAAAALATAAEAISGAVNVTAGNGDSITVTFTNSGNTITKTLTGTGSAQAVALTNADLAILGNGTISVMATATDTAGNSGATTAPATFVLDTVIATPTLAVVNANANATTAQAGAITVNIASGAQVAVVFTNGANSVTKNIVGTGAAQSVGLSAQDLTTLGNGTITVTATTSDDAGNTASANSSFVLNTTSFTAPTLAIAAGAANATAAEAQAGAVTINAPTGSTVSVVFTNGAASVTKTVTGTGAALAVTLTAQELTTLGDGTINVTATASDGTGNSASATPTSFVLDTIAPTAPTLSVAAGSANATAAEAQAGAVTVNAPAGASVSVVFSNGVNSVTKTVAGTGSAFAVGLTAQDLGTLGDGTINVTATIADAAGNTATNATPTSFVLDTVAPTAPTLTVVAGAADATAAEAQAGAVTVTSVAGDTVTVTFTNGANSLTKTITATGGADAITLTANELALLGDGTISVSASETDVAGNTIAATPVSFVLDRVAPAPATVNAGGDAIIQAIEITAGGFLPGGTTPLNTVALTVTPANIADSITNVSVWGNDAQGTWVSQTAVLDTNNGTWVFDVTPFVDGNLTVRVTSSDAAGNTTTSAWGSNTLIKNTIAGTVSVTTQGDSFVNALEALPPTELSVLAPFGETILSVVITDSMGSTAQATFDSIAGAWFFDATTATPAPFVDGTLSVVVTTDLGGAYPAVQLTLDTVISGLASINVGGDLLIDATETTTATPLTIIPAAGAAGETVSSVWVLGIGAVSGISQWQQATFNQTSGNWEFDATQFADGGLTVETVTNDAAGNSKIEYFGLSKFTGTATTAMVDVGGDAFVSAYEASTATPLNVIVPAGETVTSVLVNGVAATAGATPSSWTFDITQAAPNDGQFFVDVFVNGSATATYTLPLTRDTLAPTGPTTITVGGDLMITSAEVSTATPLEISALTDGSVTYAEVFGLNLNGQALWVAATQTASGWTFDSTQFQDGNLTVSTLTQDLAGNGTWNNYLLTKAPVAAGSVQVDAGGDAIINQSEGGVWTYINVLAPTGDSINSVTISDGFTSAMATYNWGNQWYFDSTMMNEGPLTVTVNVTGVSGNNINLTPVSLTKDTLTNPTSIQVGGDTVISGAEVTTNTALTIATNPGDTVQSVYLYGTDANGWGVGTYASGDQINGWTFDATLFGDNTVINVQTYSTDTSGNSGYAYFTLDKNPIAAGTAQVTAGGDSVVNMYEASTWTYINVLAPAGDTVNTVTITDSNNVSRIATLSWGNQWYFDATGLAEGALSVQVSTALSGNVTPVTLTLDTLANPTSIQVGGDTIISGAEVATNTALTVATNPGDTVQWVYLYGTDANGWGVGIYATGDQINGWTFDATLFADNSVINVQTYATDTSGNSGYGYFSLSKNPLAAGSVNASSNGDAIINMYEAGAWTYLNIQASVNDTINGVQISDGVNSVTATYSWGNNWYFDATTLSNGPLTVSVNVTGASGTGVNLTTNLTLDTVTGVTTVQVGTDTIVSNAEISSATPLTITSNPGDTVQWVYLSGTDTNGWGVGTYASYNQASGWTFDANLFGFGTTINVQTYTTDTSGNAGYNYFTLSKDALAAGNAVVTAGGNNSINMYEASTWTYLTVMAPVGDTINTVTLSGVDTFGNPISTQAYLSGGNQYYFDATLFTNWSNMVDTTLTVTVNTTTSGNVTADLTPVSLRLDNLVNAPLYVHVGADAYIDATEVTTNQTLTIPTAAADETVQWVWLSGRNYSTYVYPDAQGNLTFDATLFADGAINVQTYITDSSGNGRYDSFALTKSTLAAGTAQVDAGGDAFINMFEASTWTAINVLTPIGDTINTVTITDSNNVARTAIWSMGTQWYFDATGLTEGPLTVTVNTTGANGTANLAPVTLTLDTQINAPQFVHVGTDALIDATEAASTAQVLTVPTAGAGETVQWVYLSGSNYATYVYPDAQGNLIFDATLFADGIINVQTYVTDAAGNYRYDNFALTKSTLAAGSAQVDAGGDAIINMYEASTWTYINVLAPAGDTVNTVTITDSNNVARTATWSSGNQWYFDSNGLAQGALNVQVNTALAGNVPLVTLTLDTIINAPQFVYVGTDTIINATEGASTAQTLTVPVGAGETVQWVLLSGSNYSTYVYPDGQGNLTFDATLFADGAINAQTYVTDTSGNARYDNFALTKFSAAPQISLVNDTGTPGDLITTNPGLNVSAAPAGMVTQFSTDGGNTWSAYSSGSANITSTVEVAYDRDWYAVNLVAGQTYTIRVDAGATGAISDPTLWLRDAIGNGIQYNDDFNGLYSQITYTATTSGLYYLDVGGFSTRTGTYHLSITDSGAAPNIAAATNYAGEVAGDATTTASVPMTSFTPVLGQNALSFRYFDPTTQQASQATPFTFTYQNASAAPGGATVTTADSNTTVNASEASTTTLLNVTPVNAGDTIQSVTVSGFNNMGNPVTVSATAGASAGTWLFDSTQFNNYSSLTVNATVSNGVTTAVSTQAINMQAWSFWTNNAYNDLMLGQGQTGAAAVINVRPQKVGNTVTDIFVSGLDAAGNPVMVKASPTATANQWTFNTTGFADNSSLSVQSSEVDASGNQWGSGGTLHLASTSTSTNMFPSPMIGVNGGSFISNWNGGTQNTSFNLVYTGATPITSVELSQNGVIVQTLPITNGGGWQTGFTPTAYAEGLITATMKSSTGAVIGTTHLYKDTVAPSSFFDVRAGGDYVVTAGEVSATTPITITGLAQGEVLVQSAVYGINATGQLVSSPIVQQAGGGYTFDSTIFASGTTLLVGVNARDAAGNWGGAQGAPTSQLLLTPASVPVINVGGNAIINANELMTFNPATPNTPTTGTTIDLSAVGTVSSVSISGTAADGVTPLTLSSAAGGVTLGTGKATFNAALFADGALTVSVNGGATTGTLTLDTLAPAANPWNFSNIDLSNANSGLANQPISRTIDLATLFAGSDAFGNFVPGTDGSVFVAPNGNTGPFSYTQSGSLLTITANATGSGYGSISVGALDMAGNLNILDFQVAVTSNVGTINNGAVTVINTTNTSFSNQSIGNTTNDTFDISGQNTNVVINGGGGNDTFILNTAVLDFAQIRGNNSSAVGGDILQLTANHSSLNLGMYNQFGMPVLASMEVFDLATDTGINNLTLTATDLFMLGGNQIDLNGNQMTTVNGGVNDVVNIGLGMGGFTALGAADATGTLMAGGQYTKYEGVHTDLSGNNYLVELLIQNGVTVV